MMYSKMPFSFRETIPQNCLGATPRKFQENVHRSACKEIFLPKLRPIPIEFFKTETGVTLNRHHLHILQYLHLKILLQKRKV